MIKGYMLSIQNCKNTQGFITFTTYATNENRWHWSNKFFLFIHVHKKRESSSKQENFVQNTGVNVDVTQSNHELSE